MYAISYITFQRGMTSDIRDVALYHVMKHWHTSRASQDIKWHHLTYIKWRHTCCEAEWISKNVRKKIKSILTKQIIGINNEQMSTITLLCSCKEDMLQSNSHLRMVCCLVAKWQHVVLQSWNLIFHAKGWPSCGGYVGLQTYSSLVWYTFPALCTAPKGIRCLCVSQTNHMALYQ